MAINELIKFVKPGPVFIQPHDYPDPDAIASAFGLRYFLHKFGIEASICFRGEVERAVVNIVIQEFDIPILTYAETLAMKSTDKIILVDGQKFNSNLTNLPGDEIACIDHHPIFKQINYQYVDIRQVGSCSSIITDYFLELHIPIPAKLDALLLYGLMIDTKYMTRGVADLDLDIFPYLYRNADHEFLGQLESRNLEFNDLHAFGAAINNIKIYDRIGFAAIPFHCPDALIAQVADFILSLAEVDIAIIHSVRNEGFKFSVRCVLPYVHSGYMLAEVMPPYGTGGGHAKMAAGFIAKDKFKETGLSDDAFMTMLEQRFLRYVQERRVAAQKTAESQE